MTEPQPRRRPPRDNPGLARDLKDLLRDFPYERSLADDPLSMVLPWAPDPRSAEIAGIFASTVAVGNVKTIRASLRGLLNVLGESPADFVASIDPVSWRTLFHPWKHRWIRSDQMGFLALRLHEVYERFPGGLEEVFRCGMSRGSGTPASQCANGLDALAQALRWGSLDQSPTFFEPPPGYVQLFPSPLEPQRSTCKRLALFVRWMVRSDPPDLGLWKSIPTSILQVPLDTHVYWIAKHVGLTRRKTRTWLTTVEITDGLRTLDPADPVRFDFALAHTGISGDCPKHRDLSICGKCALRPDCDLWRGVRMDRGAPGRAAHSQNSRVRA